MSRKILAATIFILMLAALTLSGCSGNNTTPTPIQPDIPHDANQVTIQGITLQRIDAPPPVWEVPERPTPDTIAEDVTTTTLLQLSPLYVGELVAVMHTTMGDIGMRFFPTEAPIAVENFLTHAYNGFYDGVLFHRVIPNFMIQTGCPEGTGMGGESIWGGQFGQEFSTELRHFRGALAMAQSAAPNSIGSQFYVVQNYEVAAQSRADFIQFLEMQDEVFQAFEDGSEILVRDVFPAAALEYFLENGGTPHLDWHFNPNAHTVFGHVVWGMDVVDNIANTETADTRPVQDITITGFSFFTVTGGV